MMAQKWRWPKNEDNLKNENDLKNADDLKNEDNLKNEDDLNNGDNLKTKTISKSRIYKFIGTLYKIEIFSDLIFI